MNCNYLFLLLFLFSCSHKQINSELNQSSNNCIHDETTFSCVQVLEVYDGDTFFIEIPGQHPLFGKRMGIRIFGIDSPEIRTKDKCELKKAMMAKEMLERMLLGAQRVDIIHAQKDKYFRILGDVLVDGKLVSKELIKKKLAYTYHGEHKKKRNWCE